MAFSARLRFSPVDWYRWALALVSAGVVCWYVLRVIVPSGTLTIDYHPGTANRYMTEFASKEDFALIAYPNTGTRRATYQAVTQDPVYVTATVPRAFSEATVDLWYRNPDYTPVIRLGMQQANGDYFFEDLGRFNRTLSLLQSQWDAWHDRDATNADDALVPIPLWQPVSDGQTVLWQRTPTYASVQDFLDRPPTDLQSVYTLNVDLVPRARIPGYHDQPGVLRVPAPLRGSLTLQTYRATEPLAFRFAFRDLNWYPDNDSVQLLVRRGTETIADIPIPDPEGSLASAQPRTFSYDLRMDDLEEGLVTILIRTTQDVLTTVETDQHLLVASNRVFLAGNREYFPDTADQPVQLVTNSQTVSFVTDHESGLQTIEAGDTGDAALTVLHQPVALALTGRTTLRLPVQDVEVRGGGVFAFSEASWFDPGAYVPRDLTNTSLLDDASYIIARDVNPPPAEGGLVHAQAVFRGGTVYRDDDGRIRFIINMPGLRESDAELEIHRLTLTLKRPPLSVGALVDRLRRLVQP
ncbi:MAG: hypothetical protein HY341_01005 [Candidatus Kerfeldbacteria bacterium]|nr:hypothetical protein [Candidatus Kerfeldbacteria bacterium]